MKVFRERGQNVIIYNNYEINKRWDYNLIIDGRKNNTMINNKEGQNN